MRIGFKYCQMMIILSEWNVDGGSVLDTRSNERNKKMIMSKIVGIHHSAGDAYTKENNRK